MYDTAHRPADRTELLAALDAAGLLTAAHYAKAVASLPVHAVTAAQAAQFLVTTGTLTPFQANRLLAGRTEGFVLGAYVIQEQVGHGPAARVYKALHRAMNRPVAITMLSASVTRTAKAREAFQRETRAAARLNHPNVVATFDADQVGDRFYRVTEFVGGPTLETLVRERGPLPVALACDWIRQAAIGLQHAHEQGMIHQDIQPRNLLVTQVSKALPGCAVKIADFGMARLTPTPIPATTPDGPPALLIGTPDYVAPEQAAYPLTADHRADLYSLGCVFYFLLTGRPPFAGGSARDTVRRHWFDAPIPVERLRSDVPPVVAGIVARLLAKEPNARFSNAAGLVAQLDRLAAGRTDANDDNGAVSFELPAIQPGPLSFVTGRSSALHWVSGSGAHTAVAHHPARDAAETSPWAQLTDEVMNAATPDPDIELTPVMPRPEGRRPATPPVRTAVSPFIIAALCGTVVLSCLLAVGFLLRFAAR